MLGDYLLQGLCSLNPLEQVLVVWLTVINFAGLVMMGYDKSQAQSGDSRVREMTLWKVAFIGRAFGILAGEGIFHHKTQDLVFIAPVLLATGIWLCAITRIGGA